MRGVLLKEGCRYTNVNSTGLALRPLSTHGMTNFGIRRLKSQVEMNLVPRNRPVYLFEAEHQWNQTGENAYK